MQRQCARQSILQAAVLRLRLGSCAWSDGPPISAWLCCEADASALAFPGSLPLLLLARMSLSGDDHSSDTQEEPAAEGVRGVRIGLCSRTSSIKSGVFCILPSSASSEGSCAGPVGRASSAATGVPGARLSMNAATARRTLGDVEGRTC